MCESETNMFKHLMSAINAVWGLYVMCRTMLAKTGTKKDITDKCICFSYLYPLLKKNTQFFYKVVFFIFQFWLTAADLKTED